jgi:thymidylate synthase (FAD)
MVEEGVCPEQARMVLPQNTMTEWIWTGTLYAWSRMCKLRLDKHTQRETREVAKLISNEIAVLFPVSWGVLLDTPKEKVCALLS